MESGSCCMRRNSARVAVGRQSASWLGVNFWSRTGGPHMWRHYDRAVVREELRVLRAHGLGMTRSFFFWPDFMPEPDVIDEDMTARFADFLDLHAEQDMCTVPTFIVGHMSGQNWDPPWRAGRHLYSDVWMVGRQAWFAAEMVRRFGAHLAVAGWLVSNEMPIYGGDDTSHEVVAAWARIIRDAVRAAGGPQPFSLGGGARGIETSGRENGFRLADAASICDFIGPHVYPVGDDLVRQHYAAAWACELATTFGSPVIMEEFGLSSDFASDENAAHYYRQILHNSLLAGATGWLAWCNSDYDDLIHQDPYRHHAFELHFGLTDSRGRPKPQLAEMKAFADVLAAADISQCQRADSDTALIVPAHLDTSFPFTEPGDRAYLAQTLHQAYVSARLADLAPAVTRESSGVASGARLYLLPSAKHLLSPTCYDLERLAADGATVYASYSPGDNGNHPGPWSSDLNAMFGIQHELRNGLVDPITGDEVTFTFARDFGTISTGARLTFSVAGTFYGRAYLPVRPDGAEVIAVDSDGRPALLRRATGAGSLVLCTYPIEYMAAVTPGVNPEATSVLYDALAAVAGVSRPVTVDDARVAADILVHADGTRFAW